MPNSKIPNLSLNDTLNTSRLKFNQLLDSVGDVSALVRGGDIASVIGAIDSDIGFATDSPMGTDAGTVVGAVNEMDGRLDSINSTELLSPRMTLEDSTATSTIKGNLTVEKDVLVNGNLTVDGVATLKAGANSNINLGDGSRDSDTVTFNAEVASHLVPDADNTYDIGDSAKEWRDAYFDGTVTTDILKVDDSASITNNLTVTGLTTVDSINASHLHVSDSTDLNGILTVSATTTFSGPVSYTKAITFSDSATVQGNLNVEGQATFSDDVTFSKDLTIDSNLNVNGVTTLDSTNIAGFVDLTGNMNITENLTVGGQFTISGTASTTARYYEVLKDQTNLTSNRGGLSVFRQTEDSALLQWNEEFDFWEAGLKDSLNRLALQNDSAIFSRVVASGTGALRVPRGTTSQRPSDSAGASVNGFAEQGDIRYNSSTSSFEGYSGTSWGSLGGLIDVDQDTKIIAEIASGTDSDTLQFYTGGTLSASLDSNTLSLHTPDLKIFYSNDSATTISGGNITAQKITVDSSQMGNLTFKNQRISALDSATTLYIENTGDGAPHVQIQSYNNGFNDGTITLFAAGDIRLDALNNDIEVDGTNIYLGDQSTSIAQKRGLWVRPDAGGGYITSILASDSSPVTRGPYIDIHHTRNQPYGEGSHLKFYADSIHVRRSGLYVEDALNQGSKFDGDVTVVGNLTVEGTTTSVNSTTVELGDRIIELNSEIDPAATPTQDAGIEINRGSEDNAQLLFDESEKYWVAGESDNNTKARIVTTNYIKFPSNDALSLDSATGVISHTSRNITSINTSNGVKGINATFDSNGHVTAFTIEEGGGLTTKSGSGLSITGSNDSDISIDSAALVSHFIEKVKVGEITASDQTNSISDYSQLLIKFPSGSQSDQTLVLESQPDTSGSKETIVMRPGDATGAGTSGYNLRITGGVQSFSSDVISQYNGDVTVEGEDVGIRADNSIHLMPSYASSGDGTEDASGRVIIKNGLSLSADAGTDGPGKYGTATTVADGYGALELIPGTFVDQRGILMSTHDLILRNDPDNGGSGTGVYVVSNSGDFYIRKDNSALAHEGDTNPDLLINPAYTGFGNGPSGQGQTIFITDDSAMFSLGSTGNFTVTTSKAHSSTYKFSNSEIGFPNGATMVLWGNEGSPIDNGIIGEVRFAAENSSSQDISYGAVTVTSKETQNASEEGAMQFRIRNGTSMDVSAEVTHDKQVRAQGFVVDYGAGALSTGASNTLYAYNGDYFTKSLTANWTASFNYSSSLSSGDVWSFIVEVTQHSSSAYSITWPASVKWAGGSAPVMSPGNSAKDIFSFFTRDGSTYYGTVIGQDFS